MSDLVFYAAVCSDVGNGRGNNEDHFSLLGQTLPPEDEHGRCEKRSAVVGRGVLAVFDGMGGQASGEVASRAAAELVGDYAEDLLSLDPQAVSDFTRAANEAVCRQAPGGGATMALCAIEQGECLVANLGDSRVYLLRGRKLYRLSEDHTTTAQLVKMQLLTEEEAASDKRRHQLTQHLGVPAEEMQVQAHIPQGFTLELNDRLLLCSDGVTDALSDADLETLLAQETSCGKMAGGIVDSAMLAGSPDNATALVVKVGRRKSAGGGQRRTAQTAPAARSPQAVQEAQESRDRKNKLFWGAVWALGGALALVWGAILALLVG